MSPTFSESVTRGISRALQTDEVQNLKKEKRLQRHKSFGKAPLQSTDEIKKIVRKARNLESQIAQLQDDLPMAGNYLNVAVSDIRTKAAREIISLLDTKTLQATDEVTADVQIEDEGTTDHGIISFLDESPGQVEQFASLIDKSYLDAYKADSTLTEFLSRPVLVRSYTWTEGAGIDQSFEPWADYLNNAVIKNKLENYNFINCQLRLKIMINASPFYYGLAGVFYTPLHDWDGGYPSAGSEGNNVTRSQKPHVWIYPANSQGAELVLPFFYHKNWLDLTSLTTVQSMGSINVKSYTNLLNANSVAGTDCDIQIYAWAENVSICGPTKNAALQSLNEKKKKPIGGKGGSAPGADKTPKICS